MTDKIAVDRDFLEHAVVALEYTYSADDEMVQESIKFLRAALAQKAEPPSMPQGKSLALLDLDSVEHMQGGANGPTIRLRGFINAQTGPTAPQPPIDNAFVADGCEQFSPPAEPAPVPCCGKYETCSHACTPRGKWLGRREAERAALAAQPAEPVAWMPIESSPKDGAWMYVWRKHGTFPIQAKYNIKYAWFEDDDANHLYNLTHWMPLPAAPGAAPPAPVPPEPIAEMDAVAIKYAHKMALDLECILAEYGGSWYNTAMQTLGEYRSAMNTIHERESPTFMGEPVTAAGDKP